MRAFLSWIIYGWNAVIAFLDSHAGAITGAATLIIAWFTIALAVSTRRLWKEARRASIIAKKSADTAELAVNNAAKLERASVYVWVKLIQSLVPVPNKSGLIISFENHGRTAGRTKRIVYQVGVFENYPSRQESPVGVVVKPAVGVIPVTTKPSEPEFRLSTQFTISPFELDDIKAGKKKLLCVGVIEYSDVFGEWQSGWCWEYVPTGDPVGFGVSDNSELNYHT